jgi:hypothetical protein
MVFELTPSLEKRGEIKGERVFETLDNLTKVS